MWAFEILNLAGTSVGILNPRQVVITRNLNKASTIQVSLDDSEHASTARIIRGWRTPLEGGDRILRATGKVSQIDSQAATDAMESVTLAAVDGFGVLGSRLVQANRYYNQETPRTIVADIIEHYQNARGSTGLRVAAGIGGPLRDRTYEQGKVVADIITQLAEVDDGYYFRVDPVDAGTVFSELVLLYPNAGNDAIKAQFQYGEGTMANVASAQVSIDPPINSVMVFGSGDGDDQLRSIAEDLESQGAYGIYDTSKTYSDVILQDTLDQHALDELRPNEIKTVKVAVTSTVGNPDIFVPSPWDHFDVGDSVHLHLAGKSKALQYDGTAMVTSFTVTIDADGNERLTDVSLGGLDA